MKPHELQSITVTQAVFTNRDQQDCADSLLKLTAAQERRLAALAKAKKMSVPSLRWMLTQLMFAHLDLMEKQFHVDAHYCNAEGLNIVAYWKAITATPYKRVRFK